MANLQIAVAALAFEYGIKMATVLNGKYITKLGIISLSRNDVQPLPTDPPLHPINEERLLSFNNFTSLRDAADFIFVYSIAESVLCEIASAFCKYCPIRVQPLISTKQIPISLTYNMSLQEIEHWLHQKWLKEFEGKEIEGKVSTLLGLIQPRYKDLPLDHFIPNIEELKSIRERRNRYVHRAEIKDYHTPGNSIDQDIEYLRKLTEFIYDEVSAFHSRQPLNYSI